MEEEYSLTASLSASPSNDWKEEEDLTRHKKKENCAAILWDKNRQKEDREAAWQYNEEEDREVSWHEKENKERLNNKKEEDCKARLKAQEETDQDAQLKKEQEDHQYNQSIIVWWEQAWRQLV